MSSIRDAAKRIIKKAHDAKIKFDQQHDADRIAADAEADRMAEVVRTQDRLVDIVAPLFSGAVNEFHMANHEASALRRPINNTTKEPLILDDGDKRFTVLSELAFRHPDSPETAPIFATVRFVGGPIGVPSGEQVIRIYGGRNEDESLESYDEYKISSIPEASVIEQRITELLEDLCE
ncbi:hypothetical protein AB3662_17840 [Sorangium cellulosum]|uniref:hypothetical protein n=1 Tax=Sorangium cellulosum TaxID=56 RepID=UPI003D9A9974